MRPEDGPVALATTATKCKLGFMKIVVAIACLAVFGVLVTGLITMMKGGEFNRKYANKLMQLRIALQAVAIGLIMVTVLFSHH